jgi:hypothetical protein
MLEAAGDVASVLLVFIGDVDGWITVVVQGYIEIDWPATNLAIFNIALMRYGAINQYFNRLTAIWARNISGFKCVH